MRSLPSDERRVRRAQVILLRDQGRTYVEIALQTGLSRTGVFDICKRHYSAVIGVSDFAPLRSKSGASRLLQPEQEAMLGRLIAEQTPDQLGLPGLLWTRASVAQLIKQRCGICLRGRTTRLYLERWGFGSHPRLNLAREPVPAALRIWLDGDYPVIVARARAEAAEIHWGNERRSVPEPGASVSGAEGQSGVAVLSTVTNRGQRHWMGVTLAPDASVLIGFLNRLTLGQPSKLFLINGNLRVHDDEVLAIWLAEHDDQIEVFCLPSQSNRKGIGRTWSDGHRID